MSNPNILKLEVFGPYSLLDDLGVLSSSPKSQLPGIYIHTVQQADTKIHLAHYIGETGRAMVARNKEHIIQILGGNYQICDAEKLRHGIHEVLWNGLWRQGTRDKVYDWFEVYEDLSPATKAYVEVIDVFLIPLEAEPKERRLIEGEIARMILGNDQANSILPSDVRYGVKARTEKTLNVQILNADSVAGFPDGFIV